MLESDKRDLENQRREAEHRAHEYIKKAEQSEMLSTMLVENHRKRERDLIDRAQSEKREKAQLKTILWKRGVMPTPPSPYLTEQQQVRQWDRDLRTYEDNIETIIVSEITPIAPADPAPASPSNQ